jgi:hypothetical protein
MTETEFTKLREMLTDAIKALGGEMQGHPGFIALWSALGLLDGLNDVYGWSR